jgi:hypothetical protein
MGDNTCKVSDCDTPIKRGGYCYAHYMKNWRYGTPTPVHEPTWVDITGQRFGTLTVQHRVGSRWLCLCDCGQKRHASAGELNRTGDMNTCGDRTKHYRLDTAGYGAAHRRCTTDRGCIATHTCIDCDGQAQHWSYNHTDPDERLGKAGNFDQPVPYSLDPSHYSPRCIPCHKRFDLKHLRTAS